MPGKAVLEGVRVVEISAFVAAPLAGATLAAMGAEVVRVDPIGGGADRGRWPLHRGTSLYWSGLNQGKRSVTIDTRRPEGQRVVRSMISHAGVVLTNLPVQPWMTYDRLLAERRDLIMGVITGNSDGSIAVDYTVNAAVGFPWVTGPDGWAGPVNHVLPAWDALTGYLMTAGLIAAELHRGRTGEGQLVRLSLSDVALSIAGHLGFLAEAQLTAEPRPRQGNDLFGSFAHDFATADDRHVIVVALTPRQWASLVEATGIGEPVARLEAQLGVDLRVEGDRYRARREICDLLAPWVRARTLAQIQRRFGELNVLWAPYQSFKQLIAEDERATTKNPLIADVDQPGIGRHLRAGLPLSFGSSPRLSPPMSPVLGSDTRDVLKSWLGLESRAANELAALGVIAEQDPRADVQPE